MIAVRHCTVAMCYPWDTADSLFANSEDEDAATLGRFCLVYKSLARSTCVFFLSVSQAHSSVALLPAQQSGTTHSYREHCSSVMRHLDARNAHATKQFQIRLERITPGFHAQVTMVRACYQSGCPLSASQGRDTVHEYSI